MKRAFGALDLFRTSRWSALAQRVLTCGSIVAGVLLPATTASAQTSGTWTTAGNGTWGTTSNWSGGTVADGAGALANFGTVDLTASGTITLNTNRTIGRLIFGDSAWSSSGFDWTLQSGTLTLDNTGGIGGNPPSITVLNRTTTISSILAGSNGLSVALPWSNYDSTRGTTVAFGNGLATQTSGGLTFTGSDTLSGTLGVSGGTARVGGTAGRFSSVTALSVTGNGTFINGDSTSASNNGITNRIGDGTATLSLGGTSGAGTYTSAFAGTGSTTNQTFASLTIKAGQNVLNTGNTAAGTNNLTFAGTGGAGYVRNANGLLNVVPAAGFNPQFTNAPTAAGGSTVSGSGGNEILVGAVLGGNDFIRATSGTLVAATYTSNGTSSLTSGANINITGTNTTLSGSSTVSINSLKFTDNAARTLDLGTGSQLTIASGGILTGTGVATTGNTITNGSLTSSQGDLWIYANGSGLGNPRQAGNALTIASKITGAMSVTVGGGGGGQSAIGQQVVFGNSANDYTGGTYLANGTLAVGSDGALGATNGTVTAVSGMNFLVPTAGFTFNSARNFVVNAGAMLNIGDRGQTNTIAGQISGAGQFAIGYVSANQRLILTGTNSNFTGQYMVNGQLQATEGTSLSSNANLMFTGRDQNNLGNLETSGTFSRALGSGAGQVQWQNAGGYAGGGFVAVGGPLTVNIGGNATPDTLTWGSGYFLPSNGALNLGTVNSTNDVTFVNSINLNGSQRYINVTAAGTTKATISGVVSGSASSGIIKQDTGTLVLSGSNTYQGKTSINNGTLIASSLNSVTGGNASSSLGAPATAANGTIDIGTTTTAATLFYNGVGETTDRVINLAGTTGGATLDQSGSGLLKFTSDLTATGSGAKTLTLQGSTAGTGEIAGAIVNFTGTGGPLATALTKTGTGTWTLSGTSSYTGITTVNGGVLSVSNLANGGANSAIGASSNAAANLVLGAATLRYTGVSVTTDRSFSLTASTTSTIDVSSAASTLTFTGSTTNTTGALTKGGVGTLALAGAAAYTGTTAINAGTLQIGNGSTTGGLSSSSAISVASGATLAFNRSDAYGGNFANAISGSGGITLLSGSLTLSAANTYTGQSTVSGGALVAGIANAFGSSAPLAVSSGTVNLAGFNQTIGALSGTAGTQITTGTTAGTATLTSSFATGTSTYAGSIANNGSGVVAFTKLGGGTQVLAGANTYTGATTVSAGQLTITGTTGASGGITVADTTTTANFVVSGNGRVNAGAGQMNIGSGTGMATATFQDSAVWTGTESIIYVSAAANTRAVMTVKDSANLVLNGTSGGGGGSLFVGAANATGAGGLNQTGGSITIDRQLMVGVVGAGSYRMAGGSLILTGSGGNNSRFRIATPNAGSVGVFQQSGGTVSFNNVGLGLGIVDSPGTVVGGTDAAVGYGSYSITAGTLSGTSSTSITIGGRGGQGDFTVGGSATVNIATANVNNDQIYLGSGVTNGTGILNLLGGSVQTFGVTMNAGAGKSYVNFAGGTLKASADNASFMQGLTLATIQGGYTSGGITYAGGATIDTNGASVTIGQRLLAPTGSGVAVDTFSAITGLVGAPYVRVVGTGTGATAQAIYDPDTGSMTGITVTNPGVGYTGTPTFQIFGGGITGTTTVNATTFTTTSGGLTKTGSGTLTLAGVNTYTGTTSLLAGVLVAGTTNAFGSSAPLVVNSGSVNLAGFNQTIGALSGSAGTQITTGATTGTATLTSSFASGTSTYAGSIADNGSGLVAFTKSGAGTLVLAGTNAYTGNTSINAGTLEIASSGRLGSGGTYSGALTNNGAFIYSGTNSQTLSGLISGSGAFTNSSVSTLTLSGSVALSGAANAISNTANGTVAISGNLSTATGSVLTLTVGGGSSGGGIFLSGAGNIGGEVLVTGGSGTGGALVWSNGAGNSLSGATKITVASGNTLRYNSATIGAATAFDLNGTGNNGRGALSIYDSGTTAINGPVNLSGNSSIMIRNASLTLAGNITESGGARSLTLTADNGGATTQTYTLSGSNSFSGGLVFGVADYATGTATLKAGSSTAFGTGPLTINSGAQAASAAIVDLNGQAITVGGLTSINANNFIQSDSGAAVLTVNQSASGTFAGVIRNGAGSVALMKAGNGTLTLSNSNTFTGATTISAGILSIGDTSGLQGSSGVSITGGAGLTYTGGAATFAKNVTVAPGSGIGTIRNSGGGTLTLSGNLSKDNSVLRLTGGSFNVTGVISGTTPGASDLYVDAASVTLSNTNTYNGPTLVYNSGTLSLGINNAIPNTSAVTLGNATTRGTLAMGTYTDSVASLTFSGSGGTLSLSGDKTASAQLATAGSLTLGSNASLVLTNAGTSAGLYRLISATSISGVFGSITGTSAGYQILTTSTSVDYQQRAVLGAVSVTNPSAIITGGSAAFTYSVTNAAFSGGASLSVTGTGLSNVIGSSSGSALGGGSTGSLSGLVFTGTSIGNNQLGTFTVNAPDAYGLLSTTGTVSVNVLDHALPGFVGTGITDPYAQTVLNLDFGSVDETAGVQSLTYSLTNLASLAYGANLTAGLDLTSFTTDGDGFASGLSLFDNLVAGGTSSLFSLTFTPTGQGTFSKTFTLSFSDNRTLSGAATRRDLTINAQVIVVPEPGALALAGLGIAAAAWALRRRTNDAPATM